MKLADLDMNATYTYADYFKWKFEERVELIKGRIFKMSPAPGRVHQEISTNLQGALFIYLQGHNCKLYSAPFDVRIPRKSKDDKDILTVLQPDICVVCDLSKLDDKGCLGAPDLVIEILSPSNNKKELKNKYEVYEEAGVKEYWVVYPTEPGIMIHTLIDGKYVPSRMLVDGAAASTVLSGFTVDVETLFKDIE